MVVCVWDMGGVLQVAGSANGCLSTHRAGKISPFNLNNPCHLNVEGRRRLKCLWKKVWGQSNLNILMKERIALRGFHVCEMCNSTVSVVQWFE